AAEMGAVLGFLSRKVLGQYELVLPGKGESGDVVYLVGANVLAMERSHQFRPSEFRLWIALHECAHRLQFVGVPWLRGYFLDLVGELVASAVPEPGKWARIMAEVRKATDSGEPIIGETGLFGLFASSSQKDLLERVQALMSLLEGHGHVVMDRIGRRELASQQRMSSVLRQRRKDPRTATFLRLTGLEMKMRQYEQGEKFVLKVEREAGWSALDRVWDGPDSLPNLTEINEPMLWLSRVS
ncbi:MAG: zinc-dependent metalloprotease, partial [Acidimicrobiia bacterium]